MGSVIETNKAAHGYAEFLTSSVMDTLETKDMTEQQALATLDKCLNTMKERFVISQSSFTIKIVRKNGIEVLRQAEKPRGAV